MPAVPVVPALPAAHTMRQADMDALRRRYQEEERAAVAAAAIAAAAQTAPQHGGSGPGGSGNSGLGSGSGSGPGSVALLGAPVELQLQSRKVEKAAVQQRLKITGISTDQVGRGSRQVGLVSGLCRQGLVDGGWKPPVLFLLWLGWVGRWESCATLHSIISDM